MFESASAAALKMTTNNFPDSIISFFLRSSPWRGYNFPWSLPFPSCWCLKLFSLHGQLTKTVRPVRSTNCCSPTHNGNLALIFKLHSQTQSIGNTRARKSENTQSDCLELRDSTKRTNRFCKDCQLSCLVTCHPFLLVFVQSKPHHHTQLRRNLLVILIKVFLSMVLQHIHNTVQHKSVEQSST